MELTFAEIESLLTEGLGRQCHVEGYYQHCGVGYNTPNGTYLLKVWVEEEGWKWFSPGTDSIFQEIEYEINYWTICWAENDDFPWDEVTEPEDQIEDDE